MGDLSGGQPEPHGDWLVSNWAAGLVPALGLEGAWERGMEALLGYVRGGHGCQGAQAKAGEVQSLGTYCGSWFCRLRGSGHGLGWVGSAFSLWLGQHPCVTLD